MHWLADNFHKYPELAVYLSLGIGYLVGNVRIRGITLGGITGSLLAGILLGMLFDISVSAAARSLVFLLFLFGIGYEVGPRFFSAMRGSGWRMAMLGIFVPVVGLLTAWIVSKVLRLDPGFAAGMLSGALTESPTIGTATEAIGALPIPAEKKELMIAHIAVADAICYVGGALGVILFCTNIGPRLLRLDLQAEAALLDAEYGISRTRAGVSSAWQPFEFRAYRLSPDARVAGLTVAMAEKLEPEHRLFFERVRREGGILEAGPDLILQPGDVVVVSGRREAHVELLGPRAQEIEDRKLLDVPLASFQIFVTQPHVPGRTLEDLAGDDAVRGVFLRHLTRGGQEIPIGTRTVIERGDLLDVIGTEHAVARAAQALGEVVSPTDTSDLVALGFAMVIGALIGAAASITIGHISLSLGTSVGTLLAGIATGYLRSRRPLFGRLPDGAVRFMQSFGLAAFVAMVGLGAGPHFIEGVREAGLSVLGGGLVVTMVPLVAGLYFGRYVLRINPLLVLGALSGAQTFTAGLAGLQEKCGSAVPVIGYSAAVPIAHVLLTTWGTVIVLLTFR